MKFQTKPLEKSRIEILIELNNKDLLPFKNKALEELGSKLTLPGYRQGKAPLSLIANHASNTEVYEKMAVFALEKFYPQIINDNKINALGQPMVNITKLIPSSLVELKLEISVMPHLKLIDYLKIAKDKQKDKKVVNVDDKEINEALIWLQKTRTTIDAKTKEKIVPLLDDIFAQSFGNFKTLEELKQNIKQGLALEKQNKERERWRLGVMEEIMNKTTGELPDILIQAEKAKMIEELKIRVSEMQLPLEDYLKQIKKTEEELLQEFTPLAEKRVKMALILKKIAEKEKMEVSEEEIEKKANEIIKQLPDPDIKNKINLDELKVFVSGLIMNEKVFELLEKQ